jgi:hypothetical protein
MSKNPEFNSRKTACTCDIGFAQLLHVVSGGGTNKVFIKKGIILEKSIKEIGIICVLSCEQMYVLVISRIVILKHITPNVAISKLRYPIFFNINLKCSICETTPMNSIKKIPNKRQIIE